MIFAGNVCHVYRKPKKGICLFSSVSLSSYYILCRVSIICELYFGLFFPGLSHSILSISYRIQHQVMLKNYMRQAVPDIPKSQFLSIKLDFGGFCVLRLFAECTCILQGLVGN
jgi:hypothetical protein